MKTILLALLLAIVSCHHDASPAPAPVVASEAVSTSPAVDAAPLSRASVAMDACVNLIRLHCYFEACPNGGCFDGGGGAECALMLSSGLPSHIVDGDFVCVASAKSVEDVRKCGLAWEDACGQD